MKPLRFLGAHSPELLIGFGLAGMVVSTVLAVKATPKAMKLREEAEREKQDHDICLTKIETVKAVLPAYVPAIVVMVASAACIIGGSATNYKRNAALAAALHMSEATLTTYQNKVEEIVGEEQAKEVRKAVAKEDIRKNVKAMPKPMGNGKMLCYDRFAGRPFYSDEETLRKAALALNEDLFDEDYVLLNDFYYKLDLKPTDVGNMLGWDTTAFEGVGRKTRIIDLTFDAILVDGVPYMSVGFKIPPTYMA